MPRWKSKNNQADLNILLKNISGRFLKETGDLTVQGGPAMIVYRNKSSGRERTIVAEEVIASEDSRYVYFRTRGRTVESEQRISQRRKKRSDKGKIPVK